MCSEPKNGPDPWCDYNTDYLLCKSEIKKDLITATAAISALGTFAMGLFANLYVELDLANAMDRQPLTLPVGLLELRLVWV